MRIALSQPQQHLTAEQSSWQAVDGPVCLHAFAGQLTCCQATDCLYHFNTAFGMGPAHEKHVSDLLQSGQSNCW